MENIMKRPVYQMDEDELEDLLRDCQTRPEQVFQGLTDDG